MAVLEYCAKHNMIAYLEKIKENARFHEIMDFLSRSSIFYALTARIKKLEKRCKPSISHHQAWLRSVSLLSKKKKLSKGKSVSKQGRKNAKSRPTKDDSDKLDAKLDEYMEYIDTEEAIKEGRQRIVDIARPDIAKDEEIVRQLEVELQAKVERERQREEQASMEYIANLYDKVQVRIDVDHELAVRWTHEEHEELIIDFVPIRSKKDERMIRDMNKKAEEESGDKGVDNTKKIKKDQG
uniref:Uncharacterized protein n=1 Tax=Tanacetum cinerariifolium TaxID=118510 RepID=A0A699JAK3_TANCI|nr:hypothetical protein [Tanacetum cinerariifolium]